MGVGGGGGDPLLSWRLTSTETVGFLRVGERMGEGGRAQTHLPVHVAAELWDIFLYPF